MSNNVSAQAEDLMACLDINQADEEEKKGETSVKVAV